MEHGTLTGYHKGCRCDVCKAAMRAYSVQYYSLHKEDVAAYHARYNQEHKEEIAAYDRQRDVEAIAERQRRYRQEHRVERLADKAQYRQEFPERVRAQGILNRAIAKGILVRPDECSNVDAEFGHAGRIEGHHEDYSRPLDVQWLCKRCHTLLRFRDEEVTS